MTEEDHSSEENPEVEAQEEAPTRELTQEELDEKRRRSFRWLDSRRFELKKIMMSGPFDDAQPTCIPLFRRYFEEDLEYCTGEEKVGGRSEDVGAEKNFYRILIRMYANMPDKNKFGSWRLARWYLESFIPWVEEKGIEEKLRQDYRTPEIIKLATVRAVETRKFGDLITRIFGLEPQQVREQAIETVHSLLAADNVRAAVELALRNEVGDAFSFDEFVVPMIMHQKHQYVIQLLQVNVPMRKEYVTFLDSFIGMTDEEVNEALQPWREKLKMDIPTERFSKKVMYGQVQRFFNGMVQQFKFELREDRDAPNYAIEGKKKTLNYYRRQRHSDEAVSDAVYSQHVKEILKTCSHDLAFWYLSSLWGMDTYEAKVDAVSWMIYCKIDKFDPRVEESLQGFFTFPDFMLMGDAIALIKDRDSTGRVVDGVPLYLMEEEEKYPITVAKTEAQVDELIKVLEELAESGKQIQIGYDSEMKNVHFVDDKMVISLIQLFFCDTIWIIDCVELENLKLPTEKWKRFVECLFEPRNFQIIGFDVRADFVTLLSRRSLNYLYDVDKIETAFCLKGLMESIGQYDVNALGLGKTTGKLSELVKNVLGFEMDKSEQISNWQTRPLRKPQLIYAAMDAYVVAVAFNKVIEIAKEKLEGVDVDELVRICNISCPDEIKRDVEKVETPKVGKMTWAQFQEEIKDHRDPSKPLTRPSEVKIMVDLMLMGVGKHLRSIGIDVLIPTGFHDVMKILKEQEDLPEKDRRPILTIPNKKSEELLEEYGEETVIVLSTTRDCASFERFLNFLDTVNLDIREEDFVPPEHKKKKRGGTKKLKKADR